MDLFGSRKKKERKSHFKNMVGVAMADGKIDKREKKFMVNIGKQLGMDQSEIMEVIK